MEWFNRIPIVIQVIGVLCTFTALNWRIAKIFVSWQTRQELLQKELDALKLQLTESKTEFAKTTNKINDNVVVLEERVDELIITAAVLRDRDQRNTRRESHIGPIATRGKEPI